MSKPSPSSVAQKPDQTVARDKNKCTAHTHKSSNSRHKRKWWLRFWPLFALCVFVMAI